jgi:HK97 gp10 family phage protein
VIQAEARRNAPVLQSATKYRIRGLVRRSITVRASRLARRRGDVGVYVTVRRLTGKQIAAGKAAGFAAGRNPRDPFYFRFLEQGTRKMAARPFLGPALQTKGEEATQAFSNELRRAIVVENGRR